MHDCDLAIVGSGFGGSILAMIARRLDLRVVLIERGQHPRFAIGESASPLAGVLIEQLADRYDLPRLRPLASFGTWQRTYPEVVCGLKRGFTYFRHEVGKPYQLSPRRSNQLLVAASPNDELSDTHWLRADVDHFLVREAVSLGVEYLDSTNLATVDWEPDGCPTLVGERQGKTIRVRSGAVVDASGPRGFLSHAMGIADRGFDGYPSTQALFSHFTGVARCDEMPGYLHHDALAPAHLRTCTPAHPRTGAPVHREAPPYPVDDAALHHVFDGGWMWVLRFGNGVTSAGVAVTDAFANELRLANGEPAWSRLLARFPSIAAQFERAKPIREFTWMPRLASRAAQAAGSRWAMLPSAAAFVDPLFSTGIPLTLLGIERIARFLEAGELVGRTEGRRAGPSVFANAPADRRSSKSVGWCDTPKHWFEEYNAATLAEADHTARFIAGCYAAFPRFDVFAAYSMFYFAAASFSEAARRLESAGRPQRFLCSDHRSFADAMLHLSPVTLSQGADSGEYARQVANEVDALNIAGLCDPVKRNWYGIDPDDTIRGAAKLGVTPDDVRAMLMRMGVRSGA